MRRTIALLIALVVFAPPVFAGPPGNDGSLADIVATLKPSVASVQTFKKHVDRDSLLSNVVGGGNAWTLEPNGTGSAVVVAVEPNARLVRFVTCHHVVNASDHITVALPDGRIFDAKVLFSDPLTELALIQVVVDSGTLPEAVGFRDTGGLREGEPVIAIGSPYGYSWTVTTGVVSYVGRRDQAVTATGDWIQHDAAVNPGNSGGPVFDAAGKLVGINTWIKGDSSRGLSFAISANLTEALIRQYNRAGSVKVQSIGIAAYDRGRSVIVDHDALSPADGVKPGDVVTHIDGAAVRSLSDLLYRVVGGDEGQVVKLTIRRGDEMRQIERSLRPLADVKFTQPGGQQAGPPARAVSSMITPTRVDKRTQTDANQRLYAIAFAGYGIGGGADGKSFTGHVFVGLFGDDESRKMCVAEGVGIYPAEGDELKSVVRRVPLRERARADDIANGNYAAADTILIAYLDKATYQRVEQLITERFRDSEYQVATHDCVRFAEQLAEAVGLTVPQDRLLPSRFIRDLVELNR